MRKFIFLLLGMLVAFLVAPTYDDASPPQNEMGYVLDLNDVNVVSMGEAIQGVNLASVTIGEITGVLFVVTNEDEQTSEVNITQIAFISTDDLLKEDIKAISKPLTLISQKTIFDIESREGANASFNEGKLLSNQAYTHQKTSIGKL